MDDTAFQHTAQLLWPKLMQAARRFFAAEDDAEDAAQEALVRLWRVRAQLHTHHDAERMGMRICRNYCISVLRRRERSQAYADDATPTDDCAPSPETLAIEDENRQMLQRAVARLTVAERRLFTLRHEAGFEVKEIAAMTGTHPRSVSAMLSAARRKLLADLQNYLNDAY